MVGPPGSLGAWQVDVAERKGFFRQHGVSVERAQEEEDTAIEALVGGGRDVALVTAATIAGAVRDGQEVVMVAGAVNRAAYSFIGARGVDDMGGLIAKVVGVRDPKDITTALLRRIIRRGGLGDDAYRIFAFPDSGMRAAAIANGTAAGSLVEAPRAARLQASGFKTLGNAFEVVPDFQAEGLAVRADWARQNSDRLVRFLRAVAAADRWLYAPENHREAVDILAGTVRLTSTEAEWIYEQYVEKLPAIPKNGELEEPGVRVVVDLLAELEALPPPLPDPAKLVDTSYIQRAR